MQDSNMLPEWRFAATPTPIVFTVNLKEGMITFDNGLVIVDKDFCQNLVLLDERDGLLSIIVYLSNKLKEKECN